MAETEITIHYPSAEQGEDYHPNAHVAEVLAEEEKPAQPQDVEKTLLEAEQFLTNFAGLREENDHLKQQIQEYEAQLENLTAELQQCQIDKQHLEQALLQEREQHKEQLWTLRSELQKAQEDRLSWKEKYLDACMKSGSQPNNNLDNSASPSSSPQTQSQSSPSPKRIVLGGKRKRDQETIASAPGEVEYYANLESFGLADGQEEQQPDSQIIVTLVDGAADEKSCRIAVHQCKLCGVGFCSTFALYEHSRRCKKAHTDSLVTSHGPFACADCDFQFSSMASLKQHLQFHLGSHKEVCSDCGRAYLSKSGLHKHQQIEHRDCAILRCAICEKEFKRKDRLRDHVATRHSLAEPHECPFCDSRYKLRDYLRKHVKEVHPEQSLKAFSKMPVKLETSQLAAECVVSSKQEGC